MIRYVYMMSNARHIPYTVYRTLHSLEHFIPPQICAKKFQKKFFFSLFFGNLCIYYLPHRYLFVSPAAKGLINKIRIRLLLH